MSQEAPEKAPAPEQVDSTGSASQTASADLQLPPPEKRGGPIERSTLPDTLENVVLDYPRGLASDASNRLLLGWIRELSNRLSLEQRRVEISNQQLADTTKALSGETTRRAVAEERLAAQHGNRLLQDVTLGAGVAMLGFAIEHWSLGPSSYLMLAVGMVLVLVSILSRWTKK